MSRAHEPGVGSVRRGCAAGALALAVLSLGAPGWAGGGAASAADRSRVDRVLVLALPAVGWSDLQRDGLPNLRRLLDGSAVGSLMTNGVLRPAPVGDGYVTLGAGTRATGDRLVVGQGFGADEEFGDDTAGAAFTTRTGVPATTGLVYMPIASITEINDAEDFGAEVGLLGDALADAGFRRGVIANGDGSDPSTPERLYPAQRRAAVSALMTSDGRVPDGQVDRALLMEDTTAPFGVRLDPDAVVDAFVDAWRARSVVLVEASDLVRADIEGQFASDPARESIRENAMRDTDRMVGQLLDEVDARRDAVIVVGPAPPLPDPALTLAAVRAPGFGTGLLESSTSQRAGYVNLVDVAPTILDLLGIDRPSAMEGRPMENVSSDATFAARVDDFADANEDSIFADEQSGIAKGVVFGFGAALAIATAAFADRQPRWRAILAFGALTLVGLLVATYLAQPFHFARNGGATAYWFFVAGVAVVAAIVDTLVGRRLGRHIDALLVALGTLVALHIVDLVLGSPLALDAVFGYSANTDWRIGGIGDFAFAQLSAAAILFAGLLVWRLPGRESTRVAIGVLAATLIVIGAPMFGNDFAGLVVVAVAFGLMAWQLLGRRLRGIPTTVAIVTVLAVAILVALVGNGAGTALSEVRRTTSLNLPFFDHSALVGMVFVVAALLVYLWYVPPRPLQAVVSEVDTVRPMMLAYVIVMVTGFVMNDPGVSIPGMMAVVLEGAVVHLSVRRA